MTLDLSQCAAAAEFLRAGARFVISGHRGPDGDSIGSMMALAGMLEGLGKEVVRYCADPIPYSLEFLEGAERLSARLPGEPDWCAVLLDASELDRAGRAFANFAQGRPLLVIDHHLGVPPESAAVCYCDPNAPAVGMLVEALAEPLGATLGRAAAEAIYASVITDTGSFHYSNTSPEALRCAARMLEAGVDPWRVSSALYEAEPAARVHLLADVLSSLELSDDGRCGWLLVSRAMLDRHGAGQDLLDGFVNYARRIKGVEVAVLAREIRGGTYKCSMRSRGLVNVAAVAGRFGGGGHRNAAGCQIDGDPASVRSTVFAAVREELG